MTSKGRALALRALFVVFFLLAAELVLRWTVWIPRGTPYITGSRDYIHIQKRGVSGRHVSPGELDVEFRINSKGLRGEEINYSRNQSRRILCLGDSFTFGVGAGEQNTWPAQLQQQLGAKSSKLVEVLNAGVMGWGFPEYLIWFQKEGFKYKPDLVVVAAHAGDWESAVNGLTSLDPHGKIQIHQLPPDSRDKIRKLTEWIPFYDTLMTHSALANVVKFATLMMLREDSRPVTHVSESDEEVFYAREKQNVALLRELDHQVRNAGGKLLLVFLPKFQAIYPETDPDKVSHLFQKKLAEWALDLEIPFLDMGPIYRETLDRNGKDFSHLFYLKDGHANPRGYRLIASTIADFLATPSDLISEP